MADRIRLFFALWPGPDLRNKLWAQADLLPFPGNARNLRIRRERFHITLQFLGDVHTRQMDRVHKAAASVVAAPFAMAIDEAGSFPRVWWLAPAEPPPELDRLLLKLRAALDAESLPYERRPLTPHITVARGMERSLETQALRPVQWEVPDFVLVASRLGRENNAEYEVLASWPLAGTAELVTTAEDEPRPVKKGRKQKGG